MFHRFAALALLSTTLGAAQASAAYMSFDATAPGKISARAGDFEGGITLGSQSTSGLGNGVNVDVSDAAGPLDFSGRWIDLGDSTPGRFAQVGPQDALLYTVSTDGFYGTMSGEFCAEPTHCRIPSGYSISHVGAGPNGFSAAFLSATWQGPASAVPEPSGLLVIAAGAAGLLSFRRRSA